MLIGGGRSFGKREICETEIGIIITLLKVPLHPALWEASKNALDELDVVTLLRFDVAVQVCVECLVALSFENVFMNLVRTEVEADRVNVEYLVWMWKTFLPHLSYIFAFIMSRAKVYDGKLSLSVVYKIHRCPEQLNVCFLLQTLLAFAPALIK